MKTSVLVALLLISTSWVFAQSPVNFGPKVGINYSSLQEIKNDRRLSSDYFTGFSGGFFGRLNLRKFYIQPEIYYTQKGSNFTIHPDNTSSAGSRSGKVRLHGVDVPVLFGLKIIDAKLANLRIMAGPVATVMLTEKKNDLRVLNPDNYHFDKSNIGFQAGIGVDVANFTLDARYENGLHAINQNFRQRNRTFQLSVGLKFL